MHPSTTSSGGDDFYLSEFSPRDKPWDIHRSEAEQVSDRYRNTDFHEYSKRIDDCSMLLLFILKAASDAEDLRLKLQAARFCRVRHCPVCQWRRSLMWRARFFEAIPKVVNDYPKGRFIFLTLTVRNCPIDELRKTLDGMTMAWTRLTQRKIFPADGWIKSMEVTKGADNTAHPHFHCLLMVPPSYFSHGYISQAKWTELWKDCLRINYTPVVNVKVVKPKVVTDNGNAKDDLASAVCETLKYGVKPSDLIADKEWLLELTKQLYKTRAIAVGGCFRKYLSEAEPEDLVHGDEESTDTSENDAKLAFGWNETKKRYRKVKDPC